MIGIITATEQEKKAFGKVLGAASRGFMQACTGRIGTQEFVMMPSGAGKVNAAMCAQKLIDQYHPEKLIMVGVAGTLREDLKLGDILISRDVVQHDFDTTFFGDRLGEVYVFGRPVFAFPADEGLVKLAGEAAGSLGYPYTVGRIATGDQFIFSEEKKRELARLFQADCVEMEGAAVAQVCFVNQVPFVVLRAISDSSPFEYRLFCEQAAGKAVQIVRKMFCEGV